MTVPVPTDDVSLLRERYAQLIFERDHLVNHTVTILSREYMRKIGGKELALAKMENKYRMIKRRLELIRAYLNRGEKPTDEEIRKQIEAEYQEFLQILKEREEEMLKLLSGKTKVFSEEDAEEMRYMYKKIVKRLHPDLNPNCTEKEIEMFRIAVDAYKAGDLETIRAIYWNLADIGDCEIPVPDLIIKIVELEAQIAEIKSRFPFTVESLLNDPDELERKNKELDEELEEVKNMIKKAQTVLDGLEELV